MTGKRYAVVLRSPGIGVWFAVMVCQRFPVAMAPLALVFLGHAVTGSYATGAFLGGAHALAEAVAAGHLGRRLDARPARRELTLVLSIEALAFAILAAAASALTQLNHTLATIGLVALAAAGGAISSGAHGGLRALLVRLAPPEHRVPALSLESTASTIVWTIAPALVAGLAVLDARIPIALMAALAAAGAVTARRLRAREPVAAGSTSSLWRLSWPAMAYDGAMMFAFGAVSLALPILLTGFGESAGLSGLVLTAYTLAGIAGGLVYGARAWPGTPLRHAVLLAVGVTLALAVAAVVPALGAVVVLFALAGLFETPALTARAAALQDRLPESQWAAGFSALYGAAGLGYGAAGLAVAWLVAHVSAQTAIGLCVVAAAVVALGASAFESHHQRMPVQP